MNPAASASWIFKYLHPQSDKWRWMSVSVRTETLLKTSVTDWWAVVVYRRQDVTQHKSQPQQVIQSVTELFWAVSIQCCCKIFRLLLLQCIISSTLMSTDLQISSCVLISLTVSWHTLDVKSFNSHVFRRRVRATPLTPVTSWQLLCWSLTAMEMSSGLQICRQDQSADSLLNTFNLKNITHTCWKARVLNSGPGSWILQKTQMKTMSSTQLASQVKWI